MHIVNTRLTTAQDINRFIHGGKGICTLEAPWGTNHTYLFAKPENSDVFPDDVVFVYAVHESKHFYIGMIEQNKFRLTRNSRFLADNEITKGAAYIVKMANSEALVRDTPMVLYHNGRCARCGRMLPTTLDRENKTGFGRKCLKYVESR